MTTSTAPPSSDTTAVAADPPSAIDGERRFRRASLGGGAVAMAVFAWLATQGATALFDRPKFGNFYEAQARALFHGHWDVPARVLSFERFNVDGKFFMYHGPAPALLRAPLLMFTDAFDGRLTRLSLIVACAVVVWAIARLSWLARRTMLGDRPVSRGEAALAALVVVVASLGTVTAYVSSRAIVYHEAIIWGIAFALVSLGALVAWLLDGRRRDLVVASAAATLALLSRGSVGLGPVVALGVVLVVRSWRAVRERRPAPRERHVDRALVGLGIAVAVPVALYGYVNWAKFGAPFATPPVAAQDLIADYPPRKAAMAANGGSEFGIRYAPTILYHYFRPDGVVLDRLFPWVLMKIPTRVVGGAVFEALRPTTSMTAASPLAVAAGAIGAVVAVVRRAARVTWLAPVIGAAAGAVGAVSLAFVDLRYQGDFVPLLLVPGVLGVWVVVGWLSGRSRAVVACAAVAAALLGAWSVWVNVGTAFVFQRGSAPFATVEERAALVEDQLAVQDALGGGLPSRVTSGAELPADGRAGDLFVIGDCAAVYRHDGLHWLPVEQTAPTGAHHLVVDLDPDATGRQPVLSSADDRGASVLWAENAPGNRVRFEYQWQPRGSEKSAPVRLRVGSAERGDDGTVDVTARYDIRDGFTPYLQLRADGRTLYDDTIHQVTGPIDEPIGPMEVGAQDGLTGATALSGTIRTRPVATPVCDRLVRMGLAVESAGARR